MKRARQSLRKSRSEEAGTGVGQRERLRALQLSIHQNLDRGVQSLGIRAGMTHINEMPVHNEAHVPFGGEGNSGLAVQRRLAIEEFATDHTIGVKRL